MGKLDQIYQQISANVQTWAESMRAQGKSPQRELGRHKGQDKKNPGRWDQLLAQLGADVEEGGEGGEAAVAPVAPPDPAHIAKFKDAYNMHIGTGMDPEKAFNESMMDIAIAGFILKPTHVDQLRDLHETSMAEQLEAASAELGALPSEALEEPLPEGVLPGSRTEEEWDVELPKPVIREMNSIPGINIDHTCSGHAERDPDYPGYPREHPAVGFIVGEPVGLPMPIDEDDEEGTNRAIDSWYEVDSLVEQGEELSKKLKLKGTDIALTIFNEDGDAYWTADKGIDEEMPIIGPFKLAVDVSHSKEYTQSTPEERDKWWKDVLSLMQKTFKGEEKKERSLRTYAYKSPKIKKPASTNLVGGLYKWARHLNDLTTLASGNPTRIVNRIKNKYIGKKFLRKAWGWPK